jgi:3-dehydroquinate dehydratase/shikimate dehydrogenase
MPQPQLCATVMQPDVEGLIRARDRVSGADLVELRLDGLREPDPGPALDGRALPAIVTCRPTWEGGRYAGPEEARQRILERALDLGAEFVDVEADAAFARELIRKRDGRGIVLSRHAFDGVPTDLRARYAAMQASGAEVVKIAVAASGLSDLIPLFELADTWTPGMAGHVLIAMGPAGVPTRVLAARLRNRWTYAGDGVAPGQLPLDRLTDTFHFPRIRPDAAIYGVVGNPVLHSLSPAMHNAGFAAMSLDAAYVPLQARDADDFAAFARHVALRGASITAPFKLALLPYMDYVDPLARRVGAVNTLTVRDGKWFGANTDVHGVLAPLAGRIALKGVRATVLGTGGAARGVAVALASEGARVTISGRRPDAAQAIAALVNGTVGPYPPPPGSWDVLVNATSVGSTANPGTPLEGVAPDGRIVFDLIYVPAETRLMADARDAGCLVIGGLEMLIAQAERQFELWTGAPPPPGLFSTAAGADDRGPSMSSLAPAAGGVGESSSPATPAPGDETPRARSL